MIKVNGSRVDWLRYDFATREPDGDLWIWSSLEQAQAQAADIPDTEIVMRTLYCTGWTPCES